MIQCDLVLVPTSPSVPDVRVTMSTLPLIESLNKNAAVVLNKVITINKAGKSIDASKAYIRDESGLRVLGNHLKNRSVYQHDFITEGFKALTKEAKEEALSLVGEKTS